MSEQAKPAANLAAIVEQGSPAAIEISNVRLEQAPPTAVQLEVTFDPRLYLQRRIWILSVLRREKVTEVLDVGCGSGELLSCLCNPAPWLRPKPISNVAVAPDVHPDEILHVAKIHGVDIAPDSLKDAISMTSPPPPIVLSSWEPMPRWEPLEAKIWRGGVQAFNPEFVGVECIVATEVIEHLQEDVMQDFAPIVLGGYHPRLLLLTTPSYTYNARFCSPDTPESERGGYPDPTGRTARVFRHDDHKFEWTVEEFTSWCQSVADEWRYEVHVSGVGRADEVDEWDRDDVLGYASQVAQFTRREGKGHAHARSLKCSAALEKAKAREDHDLLVTHHHLAHDKAGQLVPLPEIGELVKARMSNYRESAMTAGELWHENDIAISCGGQFELLIESVQNCEGLDLSEVPSQTLEDWVVRREGAREPNGLWSIQRNDKKDSSSCASDLEDSLTDTHSESDHEVNQSTKNIENATNNSEHDHLDQKEDGGAVEETQEDEQGRWSVRSNISWENLDGWKGVAEQENRFVSWSDPICSDWCPTPSP
ncbi:predicted protein [Sparassis crispa]|uniref:Small RNA 2'-O-methyltransferase n=1 Tax=Sparassis crispa TaxID=139825 RepID=A0A401H1U1_9APHY|nr:predicted protein [Sparassis crispa]GBE88330.1 predicted protein [Sparassis crispa]